MVFQQIIDLLNHRKQRVTYGALASYLNITTWVLTDLLGAMRPEVSWIVNRNTWEPTGYTEDQKDPDFYKNPNVIATAEELNDFIVKE